MESLVPLLSINLALACAVMVAVWMVSLRLKDVSIVDIFWGAPGGWMTFFNPLLMTFFLFKVSGVPMLEKALAERREGYREYMERTSPFIPWPPRKSAG